MIWPGIWPFVLAEILRRNRTKVWVANTLNSNHAKKIDPHGNPANRIDFLCTCEECVSWFEPHLRWTRIR